MFHQSSQSVVVLQITKTDILADDCHYKFHNYIPEKAKHF